MKITNVDDYVHVLDSTTDTWSVIKQIVNSGIQEDPFFVCDIDDIVAKHKLWKAVLPRVEPHYAVKCNDSLTVLETLARLGTGFDCASKGEINKILSMGVDPGRIIFANPAKPASHIRYASANGVSTMTFDNEIELHKIKKLYPDAKLVIRIRCDAADAQCLLGMKFGCDPDTEAPELISVARSLDLNVVGVSFHVGSGCREPEVFYRAIAAARDLFDYATSVGYEFNLLDIGGGFPGDLGTSFNAIAEVVNDALGIHFPDNSTRVISEPGRFFVSSAFTLACNVHSVRVSDTIDSNGIPRIHRMYFINDGVYGSFNCVLYDHQRVVPQPLNGHPNAKYHSSSIWGPTCGGHDRVIEEVMFPEMRIGDWIVFENMGAYTLPAITTFNGFPIPKIHVVADESTWFLLKDMISITAEKHFMVGDIPTNFDAKNSGSELNFPLPKFPIRIPIIDAGSFVTEAILDYADMKKID